MIVPQILDIPTKLTPILSEINEYRYFLAKGGRGGAKSQSFGRAVLYLGEKRKVRVVCGREIQNTINESVYSLLADLIREYNLDYEIFSNKLVHRVSGSEIFFRGFRQQGAINIKGMEGIDIVWIDEAQAITKETLKVLIPTIRKDNAKVFFTMNPHIVKDPVPVFLEGRDDALVIDINYYENPHCTKALIREAEECKKKSFEDYEHVWLGVPLSKSEDSVFSIGELEETSINKHALRTSYGVRIAGFDIARYGDDKCSCVIIQQMGALHWEEIYTDEWGKKDLNYTTGRILEIVKDYEVNKSIIDEDGLGGGPLDSLTKGRGRDDFVGFKNPPLAYRDNREYANRRTLNTYVLKEMVRKGHMALNTVGLMEELCTLRYTFDHQQRKILMSKERMRKDGVKSPNKADSLIMAVSLVNDVQVNQDRQYVPDISHSPEENLFEIAGIR